MSDTPSETTLDTIPDAIAAIAAGELVVVVDDTDRENEGDLIMAASKATPEKMGFMVRHTSGIICVPMEADRAEALNLAPMVANNLDPLRTAFTVSVDYKPGMTTGISGQERANTANALANDNVVGQDFIRPGHMFPLTAREGGVLTRSGHTEAATDLAKLAGLPGVGVLAEVMNDDGTVKRLPELLRFAAEYGLKIVSIEDLIRHRTQSEQVVTRVGSRAVTVGGQSATAYAFSTPFDPLQHVAVVVGEAGDDAPMPCRIHREQPVTDLLSRASAGEDWFAAATKAIAKEGRGVVVFLRNPIADDIFEAQGGTEETAEPFTDGERHSSARARMQDWREVGVGAQILRDLGIRNIRLVASSQRRFVGLAGFGIAISE
ncbi:MAG: 3,4-dihydroxy-2-butanone-4-phosphate synthase [Pseudomonadota bacterium]